MHYDTYVPDKTILNSYIIVQFGFLVFVKRKIGIPAVMIVKSDWLISPYTGKIFFSK